MPEPLTKTTFLLTMEHPEGKTKEAMEYLADLGAVEVYTPPTAEKKKSKDNSAPEFDAYGNPYDKNTTRSTERDAYGNPYNKDSAEPTKPVDPNVRYDAYGNKY